MTSEYSLADVLERIYQNQLALEAAVMELTLWAEQQNAVDVGDNVRGGALHHWRKRRSYQSRLTPTERIPTRSSRN